MGDRFRQNYGYSQYGQGTYGQDPGAGTGYEPAGQYATVGYQSHAAVLRAFFREAILWSIASEKLAFSQLYDIFLFCRVVIFKTRQALATQLGTAKQQDITKQHTITIITPQIIRDNSSLNKDSSHVQACRFSSLPHIELLYYTNEAPKNQPSSSRQTVAW